MKSIVKQVLIPAILLLAVALPVSAQQVMTMSADEVVVINELGAIARLMNDTLTIEMIDPPDRRADAYKDVDLKQGDKILMCNGKRITGIDSFRSLFDNIAVGETVKFGIVRDGHLALASFPKSEMSANEPGTMIIRQTIGGDGNSEQSSWTGGGEIMILDGGLLIGSGDGGLNIIEILPVANEKITGDKPQKGDRLLSINGELDTNISELQKLYDEIADGETITIIFERDGTKHTATYVKAPLQSDGTITINK